MAVLRTSFYEYVFYYLHTDAFRRYFQGDDSKQINQVTQSILKEAYIPFPPFSEQQRIVNKINQVFSALDAIDALQVQYADNLTLLKKSILQEAVMGKLVPQDPNDEPASVLLERIRTEKERLIAEGKIKRDKNESRIYKRGNSYYENQNGKERCINDELPFEIPKSWEWIRLKNLVLIYTGKKDANYGTPDGKYNFFTCSNTAIKSPSYSYDGEFLIMPGNGANIGIVTYFNGRFEAYQRTYLLENLFNVYLFYLKYHLESNWKQYNQDKMYGSATPFIRLRNLEEYLVAFPPLAEQKRIVTKIESSLKLTGKLRN